MIIEIDDDLKFYDAELDFKVQWIHKSRGEGESLTGFSERKGITRRTIGLIMMKHNERQAKQRACASACYFCGSESFIEAHHIEGRAHTREVIMLCQACHAKFHNLNKKYRKPTRAHITEPQANKLNCNA